MFVNIAFSATCIKIIAKTIRVVFHTYFKQLIFFKLVYTIIKKFVNPAVPIGFSSMMSALMFIGGVMMLMLGLIGEYIGRMYICMNNAPQFVVRDMIEITEE